MCNLMFSKGNSGVLKNYNKINLNGNPISVYEDLRK
ncbi:hypothetical protein HAHI6034_00350 [Hathewaya histolytica]|uniref:Uncharacterized protein n=1 Tax=Hathewaya histolytica TaxID=1498 RepID=A0A4U9RJ62_HATHI|nr:Uncharacterised protein [Hathewaya histolytica]